MVPGPFNLWLPHTCLSPKIQKPSLNITYNSPFSKFGNFFLRKSVNSGNMWLHGQTQSEHCQTGCFTGDTEKESCTEASRNTEFGKSCYKTTPQGDLLTHTLALTHTLTTAAFRELVLPCHTTYKNSSHFLQTGNPEEEAAFHTSRPSLGIAKRH